MRERYLEKLTQLSNQVLDMGMLCEQAIMKTCRLLMSADLRREQVEEINRLEKEIDEKESFIESLCIQLILRQQPVAADLRRISAALKMVTDMERIGDQATDIAEILATGSIKVPVEQVPLAELAMEMVRKSMESFVSHDLEKAKEVIDSDDRMDDLFRRIREILDKNTVGFSGDQVLDLLMIAKYYERVGDHATNIGEWVEFSINGFHRNGDSVYDLFGKQ